ncbi:MAG: hypothetical protein WCI49_15710, partial [Ferruginibacter sp.]
MSIRSIEVQFAFCEIRCICRRYISITNCPINSKKILNAFFEILCFCRRYISITNCPSILKKYQIPSARSAASAGDISITNCPINSKKIL